MDDDAVAALGGEGDGVVIGFYELLWKKKNDKQEKQCQYPNFRVNIPDTIVYNFSKPQYWYFTSRNRDDRRIKKKKRQNLNSKTILEQFLPARSTSGIAAAYMWTDTSDADDKHAPYAIRYLDADGLRSNLLRLGQISDNGVLQMFVDPKPLVDGSLRHNVIQTYWQPNHISFERRQNKHDLTDARLSFQTRAETFDGTFEHSESFPLMSGIILEEIKTINNMIAEHLWFVADCTVKRMVLNFKIDAANKVWLLFCSSISVVHRDTVARNPTDLLQPVAQRKAKDRDEHRLSVTAGSATASQPYQASRSELPELGEAAFRARHSSSVPPPSRASPSPVPGSAPDGPAQRLSVFDARRRQSARLGPMAAVVLTSSKDARHKHSSYLRETFSDESWGGPANEAIKRILFDSKNLLSPSQR